MPRELYLNISFSSDRKSKTKKNKFKAVREKKYSHTRDSYKATSRFFSKPGKSGIIYSNC